MMASGAASAFRDSARQAEQQRARKQFTVDRLRGRRRRKFHSGPHTMIQYDACHFCGIPGPTTDFLVEDCGSICTRCQVDHYIEAHHRPWSLIAAPLLLTPIALVASLMPFVDSGLFRDLWKVAGAAPFLLVIVTGILGGLWGLERGWQDWRVASNYRVCSEYGKQQSTTTHQMSAVLTLAMGAYTTLIFVFTIFAPALLL